MTIDGLAVIVQPGMTVYEAACQVKVSIPVLCHHDGVTPTGGCGICTVLEVTTGRLLPACVTRAEETMVINTTAPAALEYRRTALALSLSNHPADCEAPCQLACPSGLPVHRVMMKILADDFEGARVLARQYPFVCEGAAPCERACRRSPFGGAVSICALHRWLAGDASTQTEPVPPPPSQPVPRFRSRMRGICAEEQLALSREAGPRCLDDNTGDITEAQARYEAARCLQCGCLKPADCRLREVCATVGAKQPLPEGACSPIIREQTRTGFCFDASRCILCGLCVRAAKARGVSLAPACHGRGFEARIGPPLGRTWDDLSEAVLRDSAAICPTGAMCWITNTPPEPLAKE